MAADLRTLNQKIDKGLKNKRCLEDSDKLVKSMHKETINKIKEAKTNSSAEITKQELEKSLDGMANEIKMVKFTLNRQKRTQQKPETEKIDVIISSHTDVMKVMPTAQKTGKKDTETCHYLICNTLEVD